MTRFLATILFLLATSSAAGAVVVPGLYEGSGRIVYIGVEHELPDPPSNDYFEPQTRRTGDLTSAHGLHVSCGILEERRVVAARQGALGVSLYYRGTAPRATVILIHGADAETREMGYLIPYFACNGINVVSYDQRGTGLSPGNWFLTGPTDKAEDVASIYDAFRNDPRVDSKKIGVWGFSNGGWVAPLVALKRPLAFMILKSAPTESVLSNVNFEAKMEMMRHHAAPAQVAQALDMWQRVERALFGTGTWADAGRALSAAEKQPWFQYSLMPKLQIPPPPAMRDGLRKYFAYDPLPTLTHVTTPTLALYGALDRKVDFEDSFVHMREDLERAGNRDVSVKAFPHAGHTLEVSNDGYDPVSPERFAPGYPGVMLEWLRERGIGI